jgi:CubicO group peptidase (beta-lactamase class C family)
MSSLSPLKRSNPEAEGIASSAVLDFIRAVEQHTHPLDALQGFMLLRHGNVAAEGWWAPYTPQTPHALYSLSKSFTSSAIGMAVNEGLLSVDDPVLKFFPGDAPANPGRNLKAMRVRHLLSMNTGHKEDTTLRVFRGGDENWARAFLALPVERRPGTWFVYNTAATYMLSAIITKLTGKTLLDYLRPRLFEPLGIADPTWETDPRGINIGGSGLHIKAEDIARFGQMYLQKGVWNGRRILPEAWVAEATSAQSDNSNTQTNPDWTVGYGYQFWRCRHNGYRGDGAFGQYCIVMPEQDAVLVINGGVRDMQLVMDLVWEHLLPAMQPGALPVDPRANRDLLNRLAALSLPLVQGKPSSPDVGQRQGKTYELEPNDLQLKSVTFEFGDRRGAITLRDDRGEHSLQVGYATWLKGVTRLRGQGDESIAVCGAWKTQDTHELRVCYCEDALGAVFTFNFSGSELQLDVEPNVSWEPIQVTTITGFSGGSTGPTSNRV